MTEGMMAVAAAVTTALVGGCWAVARMMIGQVERQIELMDQGICGRLEETEKARKLAGEQWRALFNKLRRQNREIAVRIDHLEERLHQVAHVISQCQSCALIPSDLPK